MPDLFLSYSRSDLPIARRFAEAFEREGFSVWWDQTLNPGESFDEVTEKALHDAKAVVVLWSKTSVASRWVRAEATQANESKTLVPVMIEPCKRPIMFELTHTADLSQWKGNSDDLAWRAYLAGLRRVIGKEMPRTPSPRATQSQSGVARRLGTGALLGIFAAVLVAVAGTWVLLRHESPARAPAATAPTTATAREVTLAVLPFINLSSDAEQEYFADGLSEELLNQLAQIDGLQLTARTSSFSFKGKNEDVRVIGKQLGVDNLLEGSVRKDGDRLRITAQLINSRDGSHLWSQTYARQMSDIFSIQEDIAKEVAQALSIKLDVGAMSRARGGTTNVAAYEKYLQSSAFSKEGGAQARGESVRLLREAVELDPTFSLAWFYLYANLQLLGASSAENADTLGRESTLAEARMEALSPNSWWYKTVLSYKLFGQHKYAEAVAADRASLAAAPASAVVCEVYNSMILGRVKEALACAQRHRRSDPLSLTESINLQWVLDSTGRPMDAQAEYERSKDWKGDHSVGDRRALARALAMRAPDDVATKALFHRILQNDPDSLTRALAGTLEDSKGARAAVRRAFADPAYQQPRQMAEIAMYADRFGDRDLALSALHRDLLELHDQYFSAPWWYWKTGLRTDPRFKDILRGLGLVDFFRASGNWGDFCKPVGTDDFECH